MKQVKLPKLYAVASDGSIVRIATCNGARRWVTIQFVPAGKVRSELETRIENHVLRIADLRNPHIWVGEFGKRERVPNPDGPAPWMLESADKLEKGLAKMRKRLASEIKDEWRVMSRHIRSDLATVAARRRGRGTDSVAYIQVRED